LTVKARTECETVTAKVMASSFVNSNMVASRSRSSDVEKKMREQKKGNEGRQNN